MTRKEYRFNVIVSLNLFAATAIFQALGYFSDNVGIVPVRIATLGFLIFTSWRVVAPLMFTIGDSVSPPHMREKTRKNKLFSKLFLIEDWGKSNG